MFAAVTFLAQFKLIIIINARITIIQMLQNILHRSTFFLRDRNLLRSIKMSITAHLLLQYVHNFNSKSSGFHTPSQVLMNRVFIASCHIMHLRQRVCIILHNRKNSTHSDLCSMNLGFLLLCFKVFLSCSTSAKPRRG